MRIAVAIPLEGDEITMIYTEDINMKELGDVARIMRASHVEPTLDGRWTADMGPVQGPVLGPFESRSEALRAEERWLIDNYL
jgi:hypothetical protein